MSGTPSGEELRARVWALEEENRDLKRRESALRDETAFWRRFAGNLNEVFYILDAEGRATYVSPNLENFTGFRPEEIIGRKYTEFVHPEDLSARSRHFAKILSGESLVTEARYLTRQGGYIWTRTQGRPIFEDGRVVGIQGVMADISDRKRAEEALRFSQKRLRSFIDSSPDFIFLKDTELRYELINKANAGFFDCGEDQIIGRTDASFMPSSVAENCRRSDLQAMEEKRRVVSLEFADGRVFEAYKFPVIYENAVCGVGGIVRDITERKKAEQTLKTMAEMLDTAPSAIMVHDAEGALHYANRKSFDLYGYGRDEFLSLNMADLDVYADPTLVRERLRRIIREGEARFETEHYRRDGSSFPLEVHAKEIDWYGRPAVLSIAEDISLRRQAEEAAAQLQEQFQQAQKMESIGRLAGGVAHDLNNLLSPVLGYGEMLLEDADRRDPRRASLEEIVSAAKRAQALVRQLLAFSRKQSLQFQAVDMNALLRDFRNLLRRTLREDIRIEMNPARSLPQVKGDIGQLEQVVMNLAVNAQDAMPHGGTLRIETAAVELDEAYAGRKRGVVPGPYVMVAVSDTGCGMDPGTLEHLFEPFFTTKEKGKGTGLGMSTAYGIIKQHGGNIWVYSEPGRGTTIKVHLPVPSEIPESGVSPPRCLSAAGGAETVLLVEDDQQVRNLSAIILKRYGYRVLVAAAGREALSMIADHQGVLDLLLTDVIMPDMNGKELYEKVSSLYPGVRVLYTSGYTDDVIAHHGVIDEGVNFIEKPFTGKALAAKVREVLETLET